MADSVTKKIAGEWLLILSTLGVTGTSIYLKRFPTYNRTDFKVIYILFVFLVIIKGLERTNFLQAVAYRFRKGERLGLKLILFTGLLSIFVTNDVALLTIVPLTLALDLNNKALLVVLETLAANAASPLTPFGNPQNLFLYYYYDLHPLEFIEAIAPLCVVTMLLIFLVGWKKTRAAQQDNNIANATLGWKSYGYVCLFITFVLAVLKLLPLWIGAIAISYALLFDRKSFSIDWLLLATFVAFFGLTDNIMNMVSFHLENRLQVFLYSALGSQIISNVPSVLLFADFTNNWKALLWGVSVGGFGSLLGSLASLISYRLYRLKKDGGDFFLKFHIYSFGAFLLGIVLYYLLYIAM
ncbi:MAG: hypothetical protein JRI51_10980 [Deltaproteobacteria bacterium]|nr:hypothetical protein [Deltaproteobacteria bacterium]